MRKFIIIDGEIILGVVEYHKELIPKSKKDIEPIGGGRWEIDDSYPDDIFFFGTSIDYGRVSEEQIRQAWNNSLLSIHIEMRTIHYSTKEYFSDVLKEFHSNL